MKIKYIKLLKTQLMLIMMYIYTVLKLNYLLELYIKSYSINIIINY